LIGQPQMGAGGVPSLTEAGAGAVTTLSAYGQRIGGEGSGAEITRLTGAVLGGRPATQESVQAALGQIHGSYLGSESADLPAYLKGALSGTVGMMAQGISAQTSLGYYGAVIRMKARPQAAGEMLRLVQEKFFTAEDPAMIEEVEAVHGKGSWDRMKAENPDQLFNIVMDTLLSQTGPRRRELFDKLNIGAEVGGRLANIQAVRGEVGRIQERMRGLTGKEMGRQIGLTRTSGAGRESAQKAVELTEKAGYGTGGKATEVLARRVAEAERDRLQIDEPGQSAISDFFLSKGAEQEYYLRRYLKRRLAAEGYDIEAFPELDITEEGVSFIGERIETERGIRAKAILNQAVGGVTAQTVIINQNGSESRPANTNSKTDR